MIEIETVKYYLTLYILNLFHKTEDKEVRDAGNCCVVGAVIVG